MKSIVIPVLLFVLTMTVTPGPNNMLLTASGARFGYRRTLPFIAGIVLGIISQLILSALGLGYLFQHYPLAQKVLKIAGSAYILYLAVKIAMPSGKSKKKGENVEEPMHFIQGALFQYLNPKAYIMTITAMSVYPLQGDMYFRSSLFILLSFLIICPLSISLWAGFGSLLKKVMKEGRYAGRLNLFLGGITALSVVFILK
ncbi:MULTISPECIES: LysE family translocator [unclassified Oceanispirochaeta]|uniref:LysE family translocator n=1 Tax=unclassified Oceanispirochaeta TaxID=2635722 RepID=UPI000E094A68|nr:MULTISPECIES: LysE family translocator [unclassified Oceanispirochaeta]MBF9019018.1 LysE family translocator [Oceanispirochaeta sp. M2]NPD75516.1 LysE family translocator [Oceanispirochaeta sp. M1]RDG28630.1 LysE family translocator [Oceanispirochaeta sp. M1]